MKNLKKKLIVLLLFFISSLAIGQRIDSLKIELQISEDEKSKVILMYEIAWEYLYSNPSQALVYADSSYNLALDLNMKKEISRALLVKGNAFYLKGDLRNALSFYNKAKVICEELEDLECVNSLKLNISSIYNQQGKYQESQNIKKELASYYEFEKDTTNYLACIINMANTYHEIGENNNAIEYFGIAQRINSKFKDQRKRAIILNGLSALYQNLDDLKSSLSYAKEGVKVARDNKMYVFLNSLYVNIGSLYHKQSMLDSAEWYYNKQISLEQLDSVLLMNSYNGLAGIHAMKGNYSKSLTLLNKAEAICDKYDLADNRGIIIGTRGLVSFEQGNYMDALNFYENSLDYIEKSNNHTDKGELLEKLIITFSKVKKNDKLLGWFEDYKFFRDSTESITVKNTIQVNRIKFQTQQKEAENQLLKTEKALQKSTIQKQRFTLFGTVVGLLLSGVISFLLYRQSGERKKNNTLLKDKNEKIESLHQELSHRVKNNLSFISTLLQLQGRGLESAEAKQAIKEGETRVEAMSILHRKLYSDTENTTFSLGEYLSEICLNLQQTYPYSGNLPIINHQFRDVQIDVESASRIGLIINELITNSFKYAFPNQVTPQIDIQIKDSNEGFQLSYQDNGVGLPDGVMVEKQQTMGLKLIHTLTKQLNGTFHMKNKAGAFFQFNFKTN